MTKPCPPHPKAVPEPTTWDARLARRLVTPLVGTPVTPNHLTTVRLAIGLGGAYCLSLGDFWLCSLGALLIALSNFVDHTDGELARISGQSSKIGHFYDLACDALVTVLLFAGIGFYVAAHHPSYAVAAQWLGGVAGVAVALIFFLRMRIESMVGKSGTKQASAGGFETEDVLYLLPLVTVLNGMTPFLIAAAIGAPLFAVYVAVDYRRVIRRVRAEATVCTAAKAAKAAHPARKDGNDFQAVR
ncbi:CDP-alcohol phosphatidyltransferase family protein [Caballeronia sp. LZ062]|uniref:CDP-alcohol phosphatidyltransferase family protein n=1 Tax=unclassified Caballeronia TaxID=2646786 RepID=UPI00285D177E|nr:MULTISPECIES: CDP-alcohol phosphatidyltransferase family protein [unclassified Caballeronia]MDR5853938.1 CDP-alcohol phosphatidyltransferase family protein [Caballeronia sp. LZ050]MDR5871531.1 CDP-alcohol phosphatidyltransferase family protein [Caballeronia sp. LZ062]